MQQRNEIQEIGLENLANAIIALAVKDYRTALTGGTVAGKKPDWVIREVEGFFYSDWFTVLTRVDPDYIIERIHKELKLTRKR